VAKVFTVRQNSVFTVEKIRCSQWAKIGVHSGQKYAEAAVEQLLFIKHCRSLDLSLPEIRQLLALNRSPGAQCDDVNRMMDRHIEQVEARIQELTRLNEQLRMLRRSCSNRRTVEQCGILRNLSATPVSSG
jgi:hypothetical protein